MFGFSSFRQGQDSAIMRVLCGQFPAFCLPFLQHCSYIFASGKCMNLDILWGFDTATVRASRVSVCACVQHCLFSRRVHCSLAISSAYAMQIDFPRLFNHNVWDQFNLVNVPSLIVLSFLWVMHSLIEGKRDGQFLPTRLCISIVTAITLYVATSKVNDLDSPSGL